VSVDASVSKAVLKYPFASFRAFSSTSSDLDIDKEYAQEIADIENEYKERKKRKVSLVGTVVSTKNAKSVTIEVHRKVLIPKYKVFQGRRKKFMIHDEEEKAKLGDLVRCLPCRPMSKKKRHELYEILQEGHRIVLPKGKAGERAAQEMHESYMAQLRGEDPSAAKVSEVVDVAQDEDTDDSLWETPFEGGSEGKDVGDEDNENKS
jgi:small subunit ribosomal protein S17